MIEKLLEITNDRFPVTISDTGSLGVFYASGMKFITTHYEAAGFGSVSVVDAKGLLGIMRVKSLILNPFLIDAPLFSIDCITFFGIETVYVELFDTVLEHVFSTDALERAAAEGENIPDKKIAPHWYDILRTGRPICKRVGVNKRAAFSEWAENYFRAYIDECEKSPACNETEKRKKAAVYSDGLLKNGGPATDSVKKALGDEKAEYYFRHILFATEK